MTDADDLGIEILGVEEELAFFFQNFAQRSVIRGQRHLAHFIVSQFRQFKLGHGVIVVRGSLRNAVITGENV